MTGDYNHEYDVGRTGQGPIGGGSIESTGDEAAPADAQRVPHRATL